MFKLRTPAKASNNLISIAMSIRKIRPSLLYAMIVSLPFLLGAIMILSLINGIEGLSDLDPYVLPISGVIYIYCVLLIRSNVFIVSKEQLVHERGVFSKNIDFLENYRIKDYKISKPFLMRLIGTMVVTLITSDKSEKYLTMRGVPNSRIVYSLRDLVELQRKNKRVYEID